MTEERTFELFKAEHSCGNIRSIRKSIPLISLNVYGMVIYGIIIVHLILTGKFIFFILFDTQYQRILRCV